MIEEIVDYINSNLRELADPDKSEDMENYMKNIQPFLGVQRPERANIEKGFKKKYGNYCRKEMTNKEFVQITRGIWEGGYREHRYMTLFFVEYCKKFITFENLELFRDLIIEGAWWDTTDGTAQKIIGQILQDNQKKMTPIIKEWTEHDDLWIRRSAILSQMKFKEDTDLDLLYYVLTKLQHEEEFFIQKAIGWALREYSKTNKDWVATYISDHEDILSNLAIREGSKYLK